MVTMVTRATTSHDDTDSGAVDLSKEANQLFSAIQVVTIATHKCNSEGMDIV